MKSLRIGAVILGLLAAALTGSASAAPIPYYFQLDFISGPLNGQHLPGVVTVDSNDCPGGLCVGTFDPTSVAKTLLGFNITVGGVPFAMNNDTGFGFGPFPDVTFNAAGRLSLIDYQGQVTFGGSTWVLDALNVNLGVDLAAFYRGTVGLPTSLVSTAVVRVPEPGTVPLLGVALIGLGLAWRRKASSGAARSAPTAGGFAA